MNKQKTIHSERLVDTRWVKVRKDIVELPNGLHINDFYAITINEAAAISVFPSDKGTVSCHICSYEEMDQYDLELDTGVW